MNNIILQLREQDTNTTNYGDGDYETILTKPITIRNGDKLQLNSAFIDTREVSTQYIDIKEDAVGKGSMTIGMTFFLYNINWCGTYKNFGTDGFNMPIPLGEAGGPTNQEIIGQQRQDGDPYFLCRTVFASEISLNSLITGLVFRRRSEGAWGDLSITLSYYEPQESSTTFTKLSDVPKHDITVYIPPQASNISTYTYVSSFVMLRKVQIGPTPTFIPVDELVVVRSSTKTLGSANTLWSPSTTGAPPNVGSPEIIGSTSRLEMGEGFSTISSEAKQVVLVPVQQRLEIDIPAGKYLPTALTGFINDRVKAFNASAGVGISGVINPVNGINLPSDGAFQRLPFDPPATSGVNTYSNIAGMPTLTQSNYIQIPKDQTYTIGAPTGAPTPNDPPPNFFSCGKKVVYNISGGDHFMANSRPFNQTPNEPYVGGRQIYNPNTRFDGWGTGDTIASKFNDLPTYPVASTPNPVFIGSSQFALEFDSDSSNRFKFTYLHTPLYAAGAASDASAICNYFINTGEIYGYYLNGNGNIGTPVPVWMSQQRHLIPDSLDEGGPGRPPGNNVAANTNGAYPSIRAFDQPKFKFVGSNGGIVFSSLYPHSFWNGQLGFDLTEMIADDEGNITQEGLITHYKIHDIGSTGGKRLVFNNFGNTFNEIVDLVGTGFGQQSPSSGISPQMPSIPFKLGVNATAGRINVESAIDKSITQTTGNAWNLVQVKDNYTTALGVLNTPSDEPPFVSDVNPKPDSQNPAVGDVAPDADQVWTEANITVIGAETTEILAEEAKLLNLVNNGYFLVEIDGKIQNELISSTNIKSTIQGIVNKYYNLNSYTSSDGSNIFYQHRGEPITMSSLRVRILNPNMSLADVGSDTTVFLSVVKSQEEDITAPDSILALEKQKQEQQKQ